MATTPIDFSSVGGKPVPAPSAIDFSSVGGKQVEAAPQAQPDSGKIGPAPGGVKGWLADLEGDLRHGTDTTLPGKLLKKMGAPGLNQGVAPGVADYMGSPALGAVHAAQGVAETPEHPVAGPLHAAGGLLEAATIPLGLTAPEVGEAAPAGVNAVGNAAAALKGAVSPTLRAAKAGVQFKEVMDAAKDVPVTLDNSQQGILRLMDWQKKTQLGPTVNKFLNRVTNPKLGDMTYGEARDFYQLLGKLSSDELSKIPPSIRYDITQTVMGLKKDIGNAAGVVGKGEQYQQAMKEFASAKKWEDISDETKKLLFDTARKAFLGGTAAAAAKKVWDKTP